MRVLRSANGQYSASVLNLVILHMKCWAALGVAGLVIPFLHSSRSQLGTICMLVAKNPSTRTVTCNPRLSSSRSTLASKERVIPIFSRHRNAQQSPSLGAGIYPRLAYGACMCRRMEMINLSRAGRGAQRPGRRFYLRVLRRWSEH